MGLIVEMVFPKTCVGCGKIGRYTDIDMSDRKQVKKFFGV